jgi:hypothetical protein
MALVSPQQVRHDRSEDYNRKTSTNLSGAGLSRPKKVDETTNPSSLSTDPKLAMIPPLSTFF